MLRGPLRSKQLLGEDQQYLEGCRHQTEYAYSLFQDQALCDVILRSSGGNVKAHKTALGTHSVYLHNRFREFSDDETVTIDLSDFAYDTIHDLLNFVYTSKLNVTQCGVCVSMKDNVGPMMHCADELGFVVVVQMCLKFFWHLLCVGNALMLYAIADNNRLVGLRSSIAAFVLDNFPDVAKTPAFLLLPIERLMRSALSMFLCDDGLRVNCELDVFFMAVEWVDRCRAERLPDAHRLLVEGVRLQLVTPEQLVVHVQPVEWLFEYADCWRVLFEAMT